VKEFSRMSPIHSVSTAFQYWSFNRERTLATLAAVEALPRSAEALSWRAGPRRAHIAWQLMHIAITEELFASERYFGKPPAYPDLKARFAHGSVADDTIPAPGEIRDLLDTTRQHLIDAVAPFSESDLETIPPALEPRKLSIGKSLVLLAWHEAHHQGQAHATLNSYKAAAGL
jgi:uncharacterized damage-inducible protein DinB